MKKPLMLWGASLCPLFLVACATYQPAPVDLRKQEAQWADRERDLPTAGTPLSLPQVEACVLRFNPALRQARATAGVAAATLAESGRWADPVLSVSAMHAVNGGSWPWQVDGGLSFTIPLSGRLSVEKRLAAKELSAAEAQVLAAENDALLGARLALARHAAAKAKERALVAQSDRLADLAKRAGKLAEVGEARPVEARTVVMTAADIRAQLRKAHREAEAERLALLDFMGLRPEAAVTLPDPDDFGGSHAPARAADFWARHPRLLAEQAAFDAAEERLNLEIKRQYPDLSIGPVAQRQGGQSSIGLGLGLPLPSLNRNRQAIAKAEAERAAAAVALDRVRTSLRHERAAAEAAREAAAEASRTLETEAKPLLEVQDAQTRQLILAGELDALRLLEVMDKHLDLELRLIEAKKELREADATLHALEEPVAAPAEKKL